jgi:hypothetical protein
MEPKIEFVPSAFRHGFTEEDIRWVLNNYLVDGVVEEGDETTRIAVGFDCLRRVRSTLRQIPYQNSNLGLLLVPSICFWKLCIMN